MIEQSSSFHEPGASGGPPWASAPITLLSRLEPVAAVRNRPHGLLEAPRFAASGELR